LLSIYGDAQWTVDSSERVTSAAAENSTFNEGVEPPLAGKPAKSGELIRGMLKSVSKAQDTPQTVGPLAAGLTKDCWIVAALFKRTSELGRYKTILSRHRFESRAIRVG